MVDLLQSYEEASGQQVNLSKFAIIFSTNVDRDCRGKICQVLQMKEVGEEVKYLGLPNIVGRNKSKAFGFLKEKMKQKVQAWKKNWITQAGREILIKNVAHKQFLLML